MYFMSRPRNFWKFGADNTVEEKFGCGNVRIWCERFIWIVYYVTPNSDSNSIRVFFLWLIADNNSTIGCFFVRRFWFVELKSIVFLTLIVIFLLTFSKRTNYMNDPSINSLYLGVFNSWRSSNMSPVVWSRTALILIMLDMIFFPKLTGEWLHLNCGRL